MKSPKRERRGPLNEGRRLRIGRSSDDPRTEDSQHNSHSDLTADGCELLHLLWQLFIYFKMITVVLSIISNDLGAGLCQRITVKYIYIPLVGLW